MAIPGDQELLLWLYGNGIVFYHDEGKLPIRPLFFPNISRHPMGPSGIACFPIYTWYVVAKGNHPGIITYVPGLQSAFIAQPHNAGRGAIWPLAGNFNIKFPLGNNSRLVPG